MTINEQPSTLALSRSPIIYHVHDSNNGDAGFRYVLEVYVWSGANPGGKPGTATWTLKKLPHSTGAAAFDLGELIRSRLSTWKPQDATLPVWLQVTATFERDSGSPTSTDSGVVYVLDGYNDALDGINSNRGLPAVLSHEAVDNWPADCPRLVTVRNAAADTVKIFLRSREIASISVNSDAASTVSKIHSIPVGSDVYGSWEAMLLDRAATDGATVDYQCDLDGECFTEYSARVMSGATELQRVTMTVEQASSEPRGCLAFVNRHGVPDYIPVNGLIDESQERRAETYANAFHDIEVGGLQDNSLRGAVRTHHAQSSVSYRLVTGWQDESLYNRLYDLFSSEVCYLFHAGAWQPVTIPQQRATKKAHSRDQLISYEISAKAANSLVNRMGV